MRYKLNTRSIKFRESRHLFDGVPNPRQAVGIVLIFCFALPLVVRWLIFRMGLLLILNAAKFNRSLHIGFMRLGTNFVWLSVGLSLLQSLIAYPCLVA